MKIAINEGYARKVYGGKRRTAEEAMLLCKEAGFSVFDFGLGASTPEENIILRSSYLEDAKKTRDFCDKSGLEIEQTHARFDYDKIPADQFKPQMLRTVEATKELGAGIVVIHGDCHWSDDFDTTLNSIYESYAPMVELAERLGVKIAVETLFDDKLPITNKRSRFTAAVEEVDALVAKFNSPAVGICWDMGHTAVAYENAQLDAVKRLRGKIIATHIHDNFYGKDLHLPPFFGNSDWSGIISTLKDIGYGGAFTLELVYGCMPDDILMDYLKLNNKIAGYLVNEYNK